MVFVVAVGWVFCFLGVFVCLFGVLFVWGVVCLLGGLSVCLFGFCLFGFLLVWIFLFCLFGGGGLGIFFLVVYFLVFVMAPAHPCCQQGRMALSPGNNQGAASSWEVVFPWFSFSFHPFVLVGLWGFCSFVVLFEGF